MIGIGAAREILTTRRSGRTIGTSFRLGAVWIVAAFCAIIIFPLAVLLALPHAVFGGEYVRNVWMTNYISDYLRLYHHPANVFDTSVSLGIAYPVFSGPLFYRLAGLIATLAGSDAALRIVVAAFLALQTFAIFRAARVAQASCGLALFVCGCAAASTDQLTNLYDRGDVPEFCALALLTTALAGWFWSLGVRSGLEKWLARSIIAVALTLLACTHTITLMLGGATFVLVAMMTLPSESRRTALVTFALAVLALGVGASVFVTEEAVIGARLLTAPGFHASGLSFFPDRIDAPFARFSPFPVDPQSVMQGLDNVSTPYLEAPIDFALPLFALSVLGLRRSRVVAAFAALAFGLALLSIWPQALALLPHRLRFFGDAYRLTAYVNVLFLCAVLAALRRLPAQSGRIAATSLPWIAGTIAIVACAVKLSHGYAVAAEPPPYLSPAGRTDGAALAAVDAEYTTLPLQGPAAPPHAPPPGVTMLALGEPAPQVYQADKAGVIFTRILVLPWNVITVDGRIVDERRLLSWKDSPYFGIRQRRLTRHRVDTYFALPRTVDVAIRSAEYVSIAECVATAVLAAALVRRRRGRARG